MSSRFAQTIMLGALALGSVARDGHATLSDSACRKLTGHRGPVLECRVESLGGGAGTAVFITTECGGDSCSVSAWVRTAVTKTMRPLRGYVAGNVELTPTGDAVVMDRLESEPGRHRVSLARVDLRTGETSAFAPCMSPVLSPGKRWIVCRGRNGDVLRVPVEGGRIELVARAAARVVFSPYSRRYPDAVSFPDPAHVRFELETAAEKPIVRVARFEE